MVIVSEAFQLDSINNVLAYVYRFSDGGVSDFFQFADAPDLPKACHFKYK